MTTEHEDLVGRLRTGDMRDRLRAAEALAGQGSPDAAAPLADALRDGDWRVRWLAADTLGRMGLGACAEPLCGVLVEREPPDNQFAIDALAELGAHAVRALCGVVRAGGRAADTAEEVLRRIAGSGSLPDVVLQEERMPMQERLLALHALHETGWRGPVRRALERYGSGLREAMLAEAREAQRVASLLRPAADPGIDALLRPAQGVPVDADPDTLLRPSPAPDAPAGR